MRDLPSGLPTDQGAFGPPRGLAGQSREHRHEPRRGARVLVSINGRDESGQPFAEDAVASSLSESGALHQGSQVTSERGT